MICLNSIVYMQILLCFVTTSASFVLVLKRVASQNLILFHIHIICLAVIINVQFNVYKVLWQNINFLLLKIDIECQRTS